MSLLIPGLAIWIGFHLFKRVAPNARAGLDAKLGAGPAKGIISLLFLASIVLMVLGYRAMPDQALYQTPGWGVYGNNVLMLVAVFLLGAGRGKGIVRENIRHPMLMGIIVWALAHLLISGDLATIILFGSMAVWAIVNMLVINMREGAWDRPTGGTIKGDARAAMIAVVIFAVIAGIHYLVGPSPFGGI